MKQKRKGPPRVRDGNRPDISGQKTALDRTALQQAAAIALEREIWIIQRAARRCTGYWSLAHQDAERVDEACGHVLRVLAVLTDRELLT